MIGKLIGKIDTIKNDHILIEVNGVGYLVFCSAKTLMSFNIGNTVELLIETHVREDHIHLYGFYHPEEKIAFNLLQTVKGVGTRMALAILSRLTPADIQISLNKKDPMAFSNISGVGKKLAERIITELKDKQINGSGETAINETVDDKLLTIANDAVGALTSLGINKTDAQNRVNNILNINCDITVSELIRLALRQDKL